MKLAVASLSAMDSELSIGAVAERTGVATSALRFYETEGLIHSERTDGGQRRYHRDVLRRVSFVRVAQQLGLSLDEIRSALASLPENRTPTKRDWSGSRARGGPGSTSRSPCSNAFGIAWTAASDAAASPSACASS